MSSKFGKIRPCTTELAALERLKKNPIDLYIYYNGKNDVITFSCMLLIRSFLYLQVTMTCMRAWMSSKLGWIRPPTTELAALVRMKKIP